jgi:hypothetical protein
LGALSFASAAVAAPTVVTTRPVIERDGADVSFFIGGVDDGGRSLKPSAVELSADGTLLPAPPSMQTLSDWAAVSSEASSTWRPPLAVGLTYLWTQGVPSGLLDAIHAFAQRIPSRTAVHPTIYGRMRQGRARLVAGEIGRLDEIPYVEGHKPNLLEAIRLDLTDLASDPAPLRVLLVITDGRDFTDPRGEGPGDFIRLGADIRRAGVTLFLVGFPPPEADAAQAAANLRDLHEAAGGFYRALDQPEDLESTLESLGQGLGDLLRVGVAVPWTWRALGGKHRLSAKLEVTDGRRFAAEIGTVTLAGGSTSWLAGLVLAVVAIAGAIFVFVYWRRRAGEGARGQPATNDEILAAAHDLIRRGAAPERAAEELTRNYQEAARVLVSVDPQALNDPRYPYFRTRPGKMRFQEIRDLLQRKSSGRAILGPVLAETLATAIEGHMAPDAAAATISARLAVEEWTAFATMSLVQLASALRLAAHDHPELGTPRARGLAVAIQDHLRALGSTEAILVGWLVRSGGPGRRGETLRLAEGRNVVGSSPACSVRISVDPKVADEHAEIQRRDNDFVITPLRGPVRVEGNPIDGRAPLTDGETIELGSTFLVFKSASVGGAVFDDAE